MPNEFNIPPPIPGQSPPSKKPFAMQAAQASWLAPILAIGMSVVVNGALGADLSPIVRLVAASVSILFILSGFIFAVVALCGIPRHGMKGILIPAIIGACINGVLVVLMAISIPMQQRIVERNREIRERQMQKSQPQQEQASEATDITPPSELGEIDRSTFSVSLPEQWRENTKDDTYQPDSFVFFEGPDSCFFNVVIGKKSTGISIENLVRHQISEVQRRFTDITLAKITNWAGFDGKGIEIEGKHGGLIRSRIRIFGFENDENVCLVSEFGDIPDLEKHAQDFEQIRQTFKLKALPGPSFSIVARQLYTQGLEKLSKGDTTNAMRDFSKALEVKPGFAEAYNKRGVAERRFSVSAAMADFGKAIELEPRFTEAYFNRALTEQEGDDVKSAITDYDKAIQLNPTLVAAHFNRGMARVTLHDRPGAMEDFDKAIELNPKAPRFYVHRAQLKYVEGNTDGALADYNKAIELQPDYAVAYEERSKVKKLNGDTSGAQADHEKATALDAQQETNSRTR